MPPRVASLPARSSAALALAMLLASLPAAPVAAVQRVVRVFDEQSGLTISETFSIAQDARGFIWVGTVGGLFRFDGRDMRHWAPDRVRHVTGIVATGPSGEVIVGGYYEPLWRVTSDGVEPVRGPSGDSLIGVDHATIAGDGALWVLRGGRVLRRAADGAWRTIALDTLAGAPYRVLPDSGGDVALATSRTLLRVGPDGTTRPLAPLPYVIGLARRSDGARVALTETGGVFVARDTGFVRLYQGARAYALAVRGDVVWASIDSRLYAFRPGAPPEIAAPAPLLPNGRPLLVDREGSLWIGGLRSLLQLPEPETVTWSELDGLPSPPHARYAMRTAEGVWAGTWAGLALLERPEGMGRARVVDPFYRWRVTADAHGRVWSGGTGGLHERSRGRDRVYRCDLGGDTLIRLCDASRRRDGTLWLATSVGLFVTPVGNGAPRLLAGAPPDGWGTRWSRVWVYDAIEDRHGTLWVTNGDEIAHAPADSVLRGGPVHWMRDRIRDVESVQDLIELPSGSLWAGTASGGVWRRQSGRWEPIPGSRNLPTQRAQSLSLSPKRGVWVGGSGVLWRVEERLDLPAGWRVLEQPSAWEGLLTPSGSVLEEADGTLWIASLAGLTRVPPSARFADRGPPEVQIVDVLVDGERRPIDRPLRLPFRRNRIELLFAAMSFRDPHLVRYEVRLRPNQPWTRSQAPDFRFVDLAPGRYRAEVRASLDGARWSASSTHVEFTVLRPWWLEGWAVASAALALLALLVAAYRVRVGFLLRLERQRARIAMDLHDEMGSGLGSIGLLAGLVADGRIDDASRQRLAAQIADAAGDLGGALSDIVWSLRDDSGTLESVAMRIAERAARLFPDDRTTLVTRFPESWPSRELSLPLRRNLQLIASEALHNAARHARASRVEVGLAADGARWRLWVEDDGCGLPAGLASGEGSAPGNGLRNLRARARAIGATLEWTRPAAGGTRVELRFDPDAARDPAIA